MPIMKTEILGSTIEINFKDSEKEKLVLIIEKFKKRLDEFKHLEGKVSDKKILFLAALKIEDIAMNNKLVSETIKLKEENDILKKNHSVYISELDEIEKKLTYLSNKIINSNNEDY